MHPVTAVLPALALPVAAQPALTADTIAQALHQVVLDIAAHLTRGYPVSDLLPSTPTVAPIRAQPPLVERFSEPVIPHPLNARLSSPYPLLDRMSEADPVVGPSSLPFRRRLDRSPSLTNSDDSPSNDETPVLESRKKKKCGRRSGKQCRDRWQAMQDAKAELRRKKDRDGGGGGGFGGPSSMGPVGCV